MPPSPPVPSFGWGGDGNYDNINLTKKVVYLHRGGHYPAAGRKRAGTRAAAMGKGTRNNVVAIGGMDRLGKHYVEEAGNRGIDLVVFNTPPTGLSSRIGNAGAVILFTGRVSHRARREAIRAAKSRDIPVFMCNSCGICTFRNCLECMKKGGPFRLGA